VSVDADCDNGCCELHRIAFAVVSEWCQTASGLTVLALPASLRGDAATNRIFADQLGEIRPKKTIGRFLTA
jgi:hypothetical protein